MPESLDTAVTCFLEVCLSQRHSSHSQAPRHYEEVHTPHSSTHTQQACPCQRTDLGPSICFPGFLPSLSRVPWGRLMQLPLPPVQLLEKLHSSGGNSDDHWEKSAVIRFILSLLQNHPHGVPPRSSNTVET